MPPWTGGVSRALMALLFAACTVGAVHAEPVDSPCDADRRCRSLRDFFRRYGSPLDRVALRFVQTADVHRLDWRLLPAISMVETTGGKYGRPQNVFGWNSGRARFRSVESAIDYVASRFVLSPIYAGRTAMGILERYNPARTTYPARVTKFMMELSPEAVE